MEISLNILTMNLPVFGVWAMVEVTVVVVTSVTVVTISVGVEV